jgi:hypothetical protein
VNTLKTKKERCSNEVHISKTFLMDAKLWQWRFNKSESLSQYLKTDALRNTRIACFTAFAFDLIINLNWIHGWTVTCIIFVSFLNTHKQRDQSKNVPDKLTINDEDGCITDHRVFFWHIYCIPVIIWVC